MTETLVSSFDQITTQTRLMGGDMYELIRDLYPICRSITGNGFRESLAILQRHIDLTLHEVPTGTQVFDWEVPKEWNIRDAFIRDAKGQKVVDFQKSNLHVLNYSVPVNTRLPLSELRQHLYSIPDQPDLVPYMTSYYRERWGFCLSHNQLEHLEEGEYDVVIDSTLEEGSLTYGEYVLSGATDEEVLISCHGCHPSLCNDNLSGMALSTFLAALLAAVPRRYSYRFLFIPGTIGAITWLALNRDVVPHVKHGLVVACVGDPGNLTYKKSRRGDAEIDRAVAHVLSRSGQPYSLREFSPYGYDERQFCSPGFDLPMGSLTRTPHGEFPEYHTSGDNLALVSPEKLLDSLRTYFSVMMVLERNRFFVNINPYCEPRLGKRGLYGSTGGRKDGQIPEMALLWVLNMSDGKNSLLDIAEKADMDFATVSGAAEALLEAALLRAVD